MGAGRKAEDALIWRRLPTQGGIETPWFALLLREAAAWSLTAMLVTSAFAFTVDVPLLLTGGASARVALATGLFAAGLGMLLTIPAAVPLAAIAALVRR